QKAKAALRCFLSRMTKLTSDQAAPLRAIARAALGSSALDGLPFSIFDTLWRKVRDLKNRGQESARNQLHRDNHGRKRDYQNSHNAFIQDGAESAGRPTVPSPKQADQAN